ncbi:MAG TPA: dihydroorotate dehydrogenase-like protein [Rhodopila sp.]|uniref:dihydroorotate dehydrogenase-like protein n=1 Tax=Rhodopila sp. TaxID=2480087 RepID=UPI002B665823|nr:dihydroorotate dehydrogenase-like protein [Rhodopila sp.]HVY14096.1 dihydroorotate dehydrogenase-like protein [Rhodopila sp.]
MDLTTRYLGLELRNPLVAGAGPFNAELDNIKRLEDLGAGAVVLPSIFEEQIEHEQQLMEDLITVGTDSYAEALTYFPSQAAYAVDPVRYLDLIRRATAAVDIPVIGSLNGATDHGWVEYARQIEEAGADAVELNIYFIPSDLDLTGRAVEQRYIDILKTVKAAVRIPVAVKIGPYFSAIGNMARELDKAGADGLVLFNRFYQPDIDLERLALVSDLDLSRPNECRLPLLWLGVLAGRVKASLAASTGVDSAVEVVKYLLAGADVVMTTSALLREGVQHIQSLRDGLEHWLAARGIHSLAAIRGCMSHRNIPDPMAFERANYIRILQGYGRK